MKRLSLALLVCAGCTEPTSLRSPAMQGTQVPQPTLLTSAVACLDTAVVAAGGQLVKRSTGFGKEAVQRVNNRVARIGDVAPSLPSSLCLDLNDQRARSMSDWTAPKAPDILVELAAMSGAQTVFVPVVKTKMTCGSKPGPWTWGKPAYQDDRGDLDCIETKMTFIGYLFDASGTVVWKAVHDYDIDEVPNSARFANQLMFEAPIKNAVPLTARASR